MGRSHRGRAGVGARPGYVTTDDSTGMKLKTVKAGFSALLSALVLAMYLTPALIAQVPPPEDPPGGGCEVRWVQVCIGDYCVSLPLLWCPGDQ